MSKIFCTCILTVAEARAFSNDNAIRYVGYIWFYGSRYFYTIGDRYSIDRSASSQLVTRLTRHKAVAAGEVVPRNSAYTDGVQTRGHAGRGH